MNNHPVQHSELFNLKFQGQKKALVVKFDSLIDYVTGESSILICHNEIDILSAGKTKIRYKYDGSLFLKYNINKISNSIDYYINSSLTFIPQSENSWGLGYWLLIPLSYITEDKPLSFWLDVAKLDFKIAINEYDTNKALSTLIDSYTIQKMSKDEWNSARLELYPNDQKNTFITIDF